MKQHLYHVQVRWTGAGDQGTRTYQSYRRDHVIAAPGKPEIAASSDPAFRGDPSRYNPEELFVASLSTCHMLWYLHLCAVNGVVVTDYVDAPEGGMEEQPGGAGAFTRVTLHPVVRVAEGDRDKALALHEQAHRYCFIARSVNFPVVVEPRLVGEGA